MSFGIQCCTRCGELEHGHTGPADRYLCSTCHGAGWRQDALGGLYQVERYTVHTWDTVLRDWELAPPIEAATPRAAYLAAQVQHPGKTVHVARVLDQPCTPGA